MDQLNQQSTLAHPSSTGIETDSPYLPPHKSCFLDVTLLKTTSFRVNIDISSHTGGGLSNGDLKANDV
jgi:hypothetical protein